MITRLLVFLLFTLSTFAAEVPSADRRLNFQLNATSSGTTVHGVGRQGGIPAASGTQHNIMDYGSVDTTGVTACDTAFAAARSAAATSGGYVYLPAGTFRLNDAYTQLRVVRGAGKDLTTIKFYTGSSMAFGFAGTGAYSNPYRPDSDILSTIVQGSTSFHLANVNDFIIGSNVRIHFSDDVDRTLVEAGLYPVMTSGNPTHSRNHTARVTHVDYGDLRVDFYPPIMHSPAAGQTSYATASQVSLSYMCTDNGIAGLTMDMENSAATFALGFGDVLNGYIYDVRVKRAARYAVYVSHCIHLEMRQSSIEEAQLLGSPNTSGLLVEHSTGCLFEDNNINGTTPGWEINYGCNGNAFTYNFLDRATGNINHGALNTYNLYWGNIIPQVKSDGYFGGSHYDWIGRNWLTGRTDRTVTAGIIGLLEMKRWAYGANVVGNYYGTMASTITAGSATADWGTPNIGNNSFLGNANAMAGDWWYDYDPDAELSRSWTGTIGSGAGTKSGVLTMGNMAGSFGFNYHAQSSAAIRFSFTGSSGTWYATPVFASISGSNINITNVLNGSGSPANLPSNGTSITVTVDPLSFQEKDDGVLATAYRADNYYLSANSGVTGPDATDTALGGNTYVQCPLYGSTKPAWAGDKPWPIFDTSRATEPSYTDLPAAHRYILGNTDYLSNGTTATGTTLNVGTVNAGTVQRTP